MSIVDGGPGGPLGLGDVPLFAGIASADLERLEHFMARFEIAEGERLFRQGDESECMHLIERGWIEIGAELADGRARALAQLGPGDLLGEMSLLGAGRRTATATAREPTCGWILYRAGFQTLRVDGGAGSVELMARIAELAVARLRSRYEQVADELQRSAPSAGAPLEAPVSRPAATTGAASEAAVPADGSLYAPEYLHSLLCFQGFHGHEQVAAALGNAQPYELPRGATVSSPGDPTADLILVLRGAVEVSARAEGISQRVRLAGPGRFVGHVGVLDAGRSPVVAHARERVVLAALAGERIRAMLRDPSAVARRFSAAIVEDVARALRQAERPMARTSTPVLQSTRLLAAG